MSFTIDQELCTGCKLCIEVCPGNIIGSSAEGEINFIAERKDICIECGHCMAICSTKAITAGTLSYEDDLFDLPLNRVSYDDLMPFLYTRRSVRNFTGKPVPGALIDQITEAVSCAPFGAYPEKTEMTVINGREKIEAALPYIAGFLDNIVKWIENPLVSFMIRKRKGRETFNTVKNHLYPIAKSGNYNLEAGDRITRGAPAMIVFHARKDAEEHTNNALIFATYAMLSAHSLGLGAAMIGIVPAAINKVKRVRELYGIPEGHEAVISLIIGYPKYKFKRGIRRRVHVN